MATKVRIVSGTPSFRDGESGEVEEDEDEEVEGVKGEIAFAAGGCALCSLQVGGAKMR